MPTTCLQLNLLLSSYERSNECVEKHGPNVTAVVKADGTILVIAVSTSGRTRGSPLCGILIEATPLIRTP